MPPKFSGLKQQFIICYSSVASWFCHLCTDIQVVAGLGWADERKPLSPTARLECVCVCAVVSDSLRPYGL